MSPRNDFGLHNSKNFLWQRYAVQRKSVEEIAKECDVSVPIIYKKLKEFGIK